MVVAARYMTVAGVLVGAYKAPDIWLKNKVNKRSTRSARACPTRSTCWSSAPRPGLTVDAAFGRVAKELARPIRSSGDEWGLTAIELGFLSERRQAFENLAERVDLEAVRGVVTTMIQTEKYGTPLASALRVLSAEFRNERMMRAEEKAARLPAIMTVPLILFILPTLFIVILGPAACSINDSFLN
jgi:tight adherence protein C